MVFQKGKSGNPSGRSKADMELRALARSHTEEAVKTLVTIMKSTKAPAQARAFAAEKLLDRGYGNPARSRRMSKFVIGATWDDVPHLSASQKAELWGSIPPYQRDARSKGIPQLGSGAIFPVPESDILVDPFELPVYWPRSYGLDVGWNRTAAVWGAHDRDTDTVYLYSEHYRAQAEPSIHAAAIKARGDWMLGTIDPASRGRGQKDGEQLLQSYVDLGLMLTPADNGVEAGLFKVWERLSTGRLKVFKTLQNWTAEYRLYRRDENGRVVKKNDHLMDATRYLAVSGLQLGMVAPDAGQQLIRLTNGTAIIDRSHDRQGFLEAEYDPWAELA